jgi:hypothetical protein
MDRERLHSRLLRVLPVVLATVSLLIGILWGGRWVVGSPKVSLTFLRYTGRPWQSIRYAELRLSNTTTNVVRYARTLDDPLSPKVMLYYREKAAWGWSDMQPDPESRGARFTFLELKPGKSVTFWAPVKPGALPKQVAIIRDSPVRSKFRNTGRIWLLRIRAALGNQSARDGLFRAVSGLKSPLDDPLWCEKVLVLPKTGEEEASK